MPDELSLTQHARNSEPSATDKPHHPRTMILRNTQLERMKDFQDSTTIPMKTLLALLVVAVMTSVHAEIVTNPPLIDDCRYANDAAARANWIPMSGSAAATVTNLAGQNVLRLRCNFAGTTIERASWDRKLSLDLTACRGIQFKLHCRDATPVHQFSIYFESGAGWYRAGFYPEEITGWNNITIDKAATTAEEKPAGWNQIKTIRISAWRGKDENTEFLLSDIAPTGILGGDALVAIVRDESAAQSSPDDASSVAQFTTAVAQELAELNIGSVVVSDLDVTAKRLQSAKLVVLPHNPQMPDRVADELVQYANGGGKLLAFYFVPHKLRAVLHVAGGQYVRAAYSGNFSTMRFTGNELPGAPAIVGQQSWNIDTVTPLPGLSRVLAQWYDNTGKPTGYPAVIGSTNGLIMTHVLLPDDAANKRRMLLAMVGYLVPEVWQRAADASLARIGTLARFRDFADAVAQITKSARADQRVSQALADARKLRESAIKLMADRQFGPAMDQAELASQRVQAAFCLAQQPEAGEFRAFWCHNAFGVEGVEWDAAIRRLADNGFTAILPNMLWGGAAFYDSRVLPVVSKVRGDQIAKCLAACKKYGIQMHVWKVNWNLGDAAPAEFVNNLRAESRLQMSARGKEELWLCPSHPANQKLEIDSMVEVARRYDVAGLHFDYIRYPDADHCFCAGCRDRFQHATNVTLTNWPMDVLSPGPLSRRWLDWRRDNISTVVKAVSEQARAIRPQIKISAAVFSHWNTDRDSVGQDWKLWCDKGWLDFVCPMDYTLSNRNFANMVAQQVHWAGQTPCYPGIGVSASPSQFGIDRLIAQISLTRQHQTHGFTIFNYGITESRDLLPQLGLGITAPQK